MPETFTPTTWSDGTGGGTAITASQLNRIELGVESMDDRVTALETGTGSAGAMPVINVKTDHGAAGDGSADDTAEIQAALDAVPTGGGIVFFPAGDYRVSAMLTATKHGTVVRGVGSGTASSSSQDTRISRLRATGTLSGNPMLRFQTAANTTPMYGCVIEDITLDGSATATGSGLHWRSYQSHINRVHFTRFPSGRGLWLQGYSGVWDLYESIISQIEADECGVGVYLDGGATDMHFTQCVIFHNGINMHSVGGASQQFTACHFYTTNSTSSIKIENSMSRTKFVNCKIESANNHVVHVDTATGGMSDLQFVGCNFSGGGHATNNTYDVINITAGSGQACSRPMIVGCSFTSYGSPANKPRYMINLDGNGVQNALVVGNTFADGSSVTGTINNNANQGATLAPVIRDNGGDGYIQRRTGTATVTSGNTTVTVTHGIVGVTPANTHVKLTPTNSMGNATKFWVTSVGATTFVINVNTDPGGTTATFAWEVDV